MAIAYDHSWEASSQSVLILSFTQVAVSKQKGLLQTTQASQLAANAQTATAARIKKYALQSLAEAQANSQGPTQAPPDTQPGIADSRDTQVRHIGLQLISHRRICGATLSHSPGATSAAPPFAVVKLLSLRL